MSKRSGGRRSRGNQFGKRLERSAKAGAEDGAVRAVFGLASLAVLAGVGWVLKRLMDG